MQYEKWIANASVRTVQSNKQRQKQRSNKQTTKGMQGKKWRLKFS